MEFNGVPVTLFEVSWEVCNKVGGIFSVVSSKALQATEVFGEDYFLLGPWLQNNPGFEESDEHAWDAIRLALSTRELKCRLGRWNIPGRPKAILVDFSQRYGSNQLLFELWKNFGVDSLSGGWDYIEPVMFATACGEVIECINETWVKPNGRSVALFHEWMCGAGLLRLKKNAPDVATVFTTHATMLGRALAGCGRDIYSNLRSINPAQEAAAQNVTAKWSMESASAREADAFTTVSPITGEESAVFLGRKPDVITTNGLDMRVIPDYSEQRETPAVNRKFVMEAAARLLRLPLPDNTRIFAISGRYEMHNKGVDIFLDALARADRSLAGTDASILALCLVMGGHTGINPDAISGNPALTDNGLPFICTHYAWNAPQDPILNACRRLGLNNLKESRVKVLFVPAMLDGHDGFFNMPYEDIISACDMGFFPSWYEPWGYTPQECAAWAVPTLTTDLSGFGMWARENERTREGELPGVVVMPRRGMSFEQSADELHKYVLAATLESPESLAQWRKRARQTAQLTAWSHFFDFYLEAFRIALEKSDSRFDAVDTDREGMNRILAASSSVTPFLRPLLAVAGLPKQLGRLRDLANNLWWCWHDKARELFRALNPAVWAESRNPLQVLAEVETDRIQRLVHDPEYLNLYREVLDEFDNYMAVPLQAQGEDVSPQRPVAYFSTEYGITESVPIYSGGLGVLSGDHLKSCSDMCVPLVGIGLLYKNGYFKQEIDENGRQIAVYPVNDFAQLPVRPITGEDREPLFVQLELPGRVLYARIWLMEIGRIRLYLLDTDTSRNSEEDRQITARLYEANREIRLLQEMLLGIGGVRMIRLLGIAPSVYHMNEGHSAFLVIARLIERMREGMSYEEAVVAVRSNTVFTTHTPVPAGNEAFSLDLMQRYFTNYAASLGLDWSQFVQLGQMEGGNSQAFEMTVLALRLSTWANGVSRLHGEVSRHMWNKLWKSLPVAETPIDYVTNGIHTPSYVGIQMQELLNQYLGPNWIQAHPDDPIWENVDKIPDETYWSARMTQKEELLNALRDSIPAFAHKFHLSREDRQKMEQMLKPNTLLIGFARRFAPYKRATLLFADPDRIARIISDPRRPVAFVFSGKSHPADEAGINILQEVIRMSLDPRFLGRIFFMEDYSLAVSRLLSQGCDVWLNNPRRPHEASGTSGMKLPVNGGINLSISDGWWCEGYNHQNGWTIGPVVKTDLPSRDQNDYADAEDLYTLLEKAVLPLYHDVNNVGLPVNWIGMSKRSLKSLTAMYSSNRMVADYIRQAYVPAAAHNAELSRDDWKLGKKLVEWLKALPARFRTLHMEEIVISGAEGNTMLCGEAVNIRLHMHLGEMHADELIVQLVIGQTYANGNFRGHPEVLRLDPRPAKDGNGGMNYTTSYIPRRNGAYRFGIRVMPTMEGLWSPIEAGLVLWA